MRTEKNRKLRGSVLFTVVFVMSILIVFLFGTLTLALATYNRAHVNYSSAQTGITSRVVAESAIKAISNNTTQGRAYAEAVGKLDASNPTPITVPVQISSSVSGSNVGSMGHIVPVTISYAGKKNYYDVVKKDWMERDLLKFTATVNQAGVDSTTSVYVIKHYKDDVNNETKGGAGFVTTAGASLECATSLYGGSYINLPKWDSAAITQAFGSEENFYKQLSSKVNGSSSALSYGDTTLFKKYKAGDTSTYLNGRNTGCEVEADATVFTNMNLYNFSGFVFPDKGTGLTVWGDMIGDANNTNFSVEGSTNLDKYCVPDVNGQYTSIKFNEVPYIYINGSLVNPAGHMTFGSKKSHRFPLNVFVGNIQGNSNNIAQISFESDVYIMDEDATSNILGLNSHTNILYGWVGSVVNKTEPKYSKKDNSTDNNIYVNGNLNLNYPQNAENRKSIVYGDLRVQKNANLINTEIWGDLVVGGKLTMTDNVTVHGKLYYDGDTSTLSSTYRSTPVKVYTEEIDNLRGYYLRWVLDEHKLEDEDGTTVYIGPNDLKIGNGVEYRGRELKDCEALYYTLKYGVKPEDEDAKSKVLWDVEPTFDDEERWTAEDNDMAFYIETMLADNVQLDDEGNIIHSDPVDITPALIQEGKLSEKRQPNGYAKTLEPSFTVQAKEGETSGKEPVYTIAQFKSSHNNENIYPNYARREVLLGFQPSKPGISIQDTKVVKTIKEILDSGVNPYNYGDVSTMSQKFQDAYADALTNEYTSFAAMEADMGKYVKGNLDFSKPITSIDTTTTASEKGNCYYINKSCYLKFGSGNFIDHVDWIECKEDNKTIVIDPGSSEIVVVIDLLYQSNSTMILVDDSKGGTADIYINDNGKLLTSGSSSFPNVAPLSYQKILTDTNVTSMKLNSAQTADVDLGKLGSPKMNIYGGSNSVVKFSNFHTGAANIISPGIDLTLAGTNGALNATSLYYNGEDIFNPLVTNADKTKFVYFGAVNAEQVSMENLIKVVYVPDDAGKGGGAEAQDKDFKYWVLYYTEY